MSDSGQMLTDVLTGRTARQFIKFAVGGSIGTAFHYAVLVVLVEGFTVSATAGTSVGFVVGACVNYAIAREFVFKTRRSHRAALGRFLIIALVGGILNTSMIGALERVGVYYLGAQVLATAVVLMWNFLGNKFWSFADDVAH